MRSLVACKAIVSAAYNLWLLYEVRTDEITIIAIYIDNVLRSDEEKSFQSESSIAEASASVYEHIHASKSAVEFPWQPSIPPSPIGSASPYVAGT